MFAPGQWVTDGTHTGQIEAMDIQSSDGITGCLIQCLGYVTVIPESELKYADCLDLATGQEFELVSQRGRGIALSWEDGRCYLDLTRLAQEPGLPSRVYIGRGTKTIHVVYPEGKIVSYDSVSDYGYDEDGYLIMDFANGDTCVVSPGFESVEIHG